MKLLQSEFLRETGLARSRVENLPKVIAKREAEVEAVQRDLQKAKQLSDISIRTPDGRTITDRKEMNAFLLRAVNEKLKNPEKEMQPFHIGDFAVSVSTFGDDARFSISGEHPYFCAAGASESQNNVARFSNYFEKGIAKTAADLKQDMESMQMNLRQSEERVTMPFQHQAELESKEKEFRNWRNGCPRFPCRRMRSLTRRKKQTRLRKQMKEKASVLRSLVRATRTM